MIESINQSHPLPVLFPNEEDERRKNSGGTILYILYLHASKTSHLFPNDEDERRKNSGGTISDMFFCSTYNIYDTLRDIKDVERFQPNS